MKKLWVARVELESVIYAKDEEEAQEVALFQAWGSGALDGLCPDDIEILPLNSEDDLPEGYSGDTFAWGMVIESKVEDKTISELLVEIEKSK